MKEEKTQYKPKGILHQLLEKYEAEMEKLKKDFRKIDSPPAMASSCYTGSLIVYAKIISDLKEAVKDAAWCGTYS